MPVTRDVITDLWPVYESGEASADTRALVDDFLRGDPELAAELRRAETAVLPPAPTLPAEHARQALARTQRLVRRGQWLLGLALFFTLLPMAGIQTGRVRWALWWDFPAGAVASLVVASILWIACVAHRRRLRVIGL
jgi:ferric-dicitrate binding protein FerR (iron transport regulator)